MVRLPLQQQRQRVHASRGRGHLLLRLLRLLRGRRRLLLHLRQHHHGALLRLLVALQCCRPSRRQVQPSRVKQLRQGEVRLRHLHTHTHTQNRWQPSASSVTALPKVCHGSAM